MLQATRAEQGQQSPVTRGTVVRCIHKQVWEPTGFQTELLLVGVTSGIIPSSRKHGLEQVPVGRIQSTLLSATSLLFWPWLRLI